MKRLQIGFVICWLFSTPAVEASPLPKTELQWAICEPSSRQLLEKLGTSPEDFETSFASYFDTPNLSLFSAGIFLHISSQISKAKIQFTDSRAVDFEWIKDHGGQCEYDRYGANKTIRCAVKHKLHNDGIQWSEKQIAFLKRFKDTEIPKSLNQWGPYRVESWSMAIPSYTDQENLTIESLDTGDPALKPITEISLRVPSDRADDIHFKIETLLRQHHIELCLLQAGKFERLINFMISREKQR